MSENRPTEPTASAAAHQPFVHPWCIPGPPHARYVRFLATAQLRNASFALGMVLVLFGHGWGMAAVGFAVGCDLAASRLRRAAWAGLNIPAVAIPTPPAVARIRGLGTLVLSVAAASAVAGHSDVGAFVAVLLGTAGVFDALSNVVHDARSGSMAPATSASLHVLSATCCGAIAVTIGHLDAATWASFTVASAGLITLVLLLRWTLRLSRTVQRRNIFTSR